MQQPEGTKEDATGTTAGTSGVTADVKAVTHSVTSQTPAKTKKASDSIYHERQGCGLFWAVGRFRPTNYMILCQRPLNADMKKPNHNADFIAPLFRNHLMPYRKFLYALPFANRIYKFAVEDIVGAYGMINYVDARTVWMDDIVKKAQADDICQVVIIAAGYCTRAYRLRTGNTMFYEVDLPQVSEKKISLVDAVIPDKQKYPRPAYVAADLAVTPLKEALTAKGFDPSKPALFTCEGILTYLPQDAVDGLIKQISELASPGSRICMDMVDKAYMDGTVKNRGYSCGSEALKARGEPLLSGFETTPEAVSTYFRPHGWQLLELLGPKEMMQKWMSHLKWSDRRPPLLIFESYALLQKGVPYPLPAVAAAVANETAPATQLPPAPDPAAAPEPSAAAPATQAAEVAAEPEQAAAQAPEGVPAALSA
ncbi:g3190 [Coccomyxa elongata]